MALRFKNVSSSAIRRVGFDSKTDEMVIEFTSSAKQYTYPGVAKTVPRDLARASSPGGYYNRNIRSR